MKNNIKINVVINIVTTVVLTFLSFITFPWACRYLGEEKLGVYSWALSFVNYFLILAKVGIPTLAVRECAKVRDNTKELSNKVQLFFIISLITTLISFALMTSIVLICKKAFTDPAIIFVLSLNFLVGVFSFEWLYIALEKQFYLSIRSIISLTLSAILIIVFVKSPDHIYLYAGITIFGTLFNSICNMLFLRRFVSFKKEQPYNFKDYLKPLGLLCLISMLITLYNHTDTFILGLINSNKIEVASYAVGIKGINIIIGIITSLGTVFIPRATYYYSIENKESFNDLNKYSTNIALFIVFPALITMSVLAKPICGLISGRNYYIDSGEYMNAPIVLIILSTIMITHSLSDIIYGQILLPMKKEKIYMVSIGSGLLLNIILSLIFGILVFKKNPSIGVSIATLLGDLFVFIFLLVNSWKYSKNAIVNKNGLKFIIASIILTISSLSIHVLFTKVISNKIASFNVQYALEIFLVVFIGAIVYLLILRILKEDLVCSFINKINKKEEFENEK